MLVAAASPLRSRSRLSPVTNAENTASEGRGRIRPPPRPQPPCTDIDARPLGRTGPTKWPAPGALQRPSPVPPAQRPHPPDLRGRQQSSYLQPERSSALSTAAASWSRTRWGRQGSNHFGGGGHRAPAPEPGGGAQEIPPGTVCCLPLVQAWLGPEHSTQPLSVRLLTVSPLVRLSPSTTVRPTSRVLRAAPGAD